MKKLLIFILLLSEIAVAQNVSVITNEKILSSDLKYCFPSFGPNGEKIAFTTENFIGLYVFNTKTRKHIKITDKQGAGYNPVFSNDGTIIYYRSNEYDGMKKYSSIYSKNLFDNNITVFENRKRKLSTPKIINNKLLYTVENNVKILDTPENIESSQSQDIWTCIENQKIVVYRNNDKTVLTPKGDGNYIWPELSPDKSKILFTFAGHGTFISDMEGNILTDLGYLNASKWLNDDWVIGMKDYDNGDFVTDSDIYALTSDGQKSIQLTKTKDTIEMYPNCSSNNSKIVYHTLEGDVYLMTLKIK